MNVLLILPDAAGVSEALRFYEPRLTDRGFQLCLMPIS